ncbi:hypothetical protein GpartN1_g6190.t1 [Galdieria partita]|uniref:50S ribosomal protein L13 n=1 Tax=Galdieria partita TaxID=83374 RepID=A0A9C7Q157_9RHOD|nr:hypothetical protein GpartN1_g6190.t1 [Galdieria partita]
MPSFAKDLKHISKVDKIWRLVDAKGEILGRVGNVVAHLLQGKHKPYYDRSVLCGDPVVVVNARYVELTGRKWKTRVYKKHSGYPGGLNEFPAKELIKEKPEELIYETVRHMLPKNDLGREMLGILRVYPDEEHPHVNQQLVPVPPTGKDKRLTVEGILEQDEKEELWRRILVSVPPQELSRQIIEIKRKLSESRISPQVISEKKLKDLLEAYETGPHGESIAKYLQYVGDENIPVEEVIKDFS